MLKRLFFLTTGLTLLLALSPTPTSAANFPVIRGTVKDAAGNPIPNLAITAGSNGLDTSTCTDSQGRYALQAKANSEVILAVRSISFYTINGEDRRFGCEQGSRADRLLEANFSFLLANSDVQKNITAPNPFDIRLTAVDDAGNPIVGALVSFSALFPYALNDALGDGILRRFDTSENGDGLTLTTDYSGRVTVHAYEFATSDSGIDSWCSSNPYCSDDDSLTGIERVISPRFLIYYQPRPGVNQSLVSAFTEWSDGSATVEIPFVPDLTMSAPTSAKVNSQVTVTSAISQYVTPLAASSKFKGKSMNLYSRSYANPAKPGKWTKAGTCKFAATGKCSVKVKLKSTIQVQARPVGFSSSVRTKTIKAKR
ncbi:MAG: Carboxypeptidase regulatory-like domain [Actinomycetota bacterium]|jgi:hypothetical protein